MSEENNYFKEREDYFKEHWQSTLDENKKLYQSGYSFAQSFDSMSLPSGLLIFTLAPVMTRFIAEFIPSGNSAAAEPLIRIGVDAIVVIIFMSIAGYTIQRLAQVWHNPGRVTHRFEHEKVKFLIGLPPYDNDDTAFSRLNQRCEQIADNALERS